MGAAACRAIAEMKEFATFPAATQRYIRRSLDVAAGREDSVHLWARTVEEAREIRDQGAVYERLEMIRRRMPDGPEVAAAEPMMMPLISIAAFDLSTGRLNSFQAFRFLYERLVGVSARPWLPSAFVAAAALPGIHPDQRRKLLTSISEAAATAAGWSSRDVTFFPTWVEKVEPEAV